MKIKTYVYAPTTLSSSNGVSSNSTMCDKNSRDNLVNYISNIIVENSLTKTFNYTIEKLRNVTFTISVDKTGIDNSDFKLMINIESIIDTDLDVDTLYDIFEHDKVFTNKLYDTLQSYIINDVYYSNIYVPQDEIYVFDSNNYYYIKFEPTKLYTPEFKEFVVEQCIDYDDIINNLYIS